MNDSLYIAAVHFSCDALHVEEWTKSPCPFHGRDSHTQQVGLVIPMGPEVSDQNSWVV